MKVYGPTKDEVIQDAVERRRERVDSASCAVPCLAPRETPFSVQVRFGERPEGLPEWMWANDPNDETARTKDEHGDSALYQMIGVTGPARVRVTIVPTVTFSDDGRGEFIHEVYASMVQLICGDLPQVTIRPPRGAYGGMLLANRMNGAIVVRASVALRGTMVIIIHVERPDRVSEAAAL